MHNWLTLLCQVRPLFSRGCSYSRLLTIFLRQQTSRLNVKLLFADLLFKPEEMVLFRNVKDGGLALVSCKFKSLAFRIKTFLELAAHQSY